MREEEGKTRHDLGREELVKRIWQWKDQYEARILNQLKQLGASCDWARTRFTLDPVCARAVRQTFFNMFRDGYIFRGKRLVNWDAQLQTSVADDETYTEEVKGGFWTFRYPVEGSVSDGGGQPVANPSGSEKPQFIRFSTTRPETMLGDTAVAVHPNDERYKHLIGKMVTIPARESGHPDHRRRPAGRSDAGHRLREGDAGARSQRLRLRPAAQAADDQHPQPGRHDQRERRQVRRDGPHQGPRGGDGGHGGPRLLRGPRGPRHSD